MWLPLLIMAFYGLCSVRAPWESSTVRITWLVSDFVVMPGMVYLMAHMRPGRYLEAICVFLGRLSYPLYLVHQPIVMFFNRLIGNMHVHGLRLAAMIVLQMSTPVATALAALFLYDEPIRKRLSAWYRTRRNHPISI